MRRQIGESQKLFTTNLMCELSLAKDDVSKVPKQATQEWEVVCFPSYVGQECLSSQDEVVKVL